MLHFVRPGFCILNSIPISANERRLAVKTPTVPVSELVRMGDSIPYDLTAGFAPVELLGGGVILKETSGR